MIAGSAQSLAVGGALEVILLNSFLPESVDSVTIMAATGGVSGSFTTINLPALAGGLKWVVQTNPNDITLVTALAADLNGDNVVDTADLGILLGQFGSANPIADINGDGVVDTADLGILLGGFGAVCP